MLFKNIFYSVKKIKYLKFCVKKKNCAVLQKQAKLWANLTKPSCFPTETVDSIFSQNII